MHPNYEVATSDCFSTRTQHSDMSSGAGYDQFSSPAVLQSEHFDLNINNKRWFLGTPRCNVKAMWYSAAEKVNSLTLDLQCKLWHHRLGNPGQHALCLASYTCDTIPNLQRHPVLNAGISSQQIFTNIRRDVMIKMQLLNLENCFKWIADSILERSFLPLNRLNHHPEKRNLTQWLWKH